MKRAAAVSPETPLAELFALRPEQKKALTRLRITTAQDLLLYFPARYEQRGAQSAITALTKGTDAVIYGRVVSVKVARGWRTKIPMGEAVIEDGSGTIKAVWFHQPYIVKTLNPGSAVKVSGKVQERKGELYLANPRVEPLADLPDIASSLFGGAEETETMLPIYPETEGVTSLWLRHHVETLIKKGVHEQIADPIPEEILKRYHLPSLATALVWVHLPQKEPDAAAARKRFAFEEVFAIQLSRIRDRALYNARAAFPVTLSQSDRAAFVARFPFPLTNAQTRTVNDVLADIATERPMARLIEGDVGSGKTAVAAVAAYATITSAPPDNRFARLQVAYMAPTEILARQHFESFLEYFRGSGVGIGLITGSGCVKFPSKVDPSGTTPISRAQFLRFLKDGELSIVIGTHALVEKAVDFRHLALAIVDEQHRFGTMQRAKLLRKGERVPHLLSMTATPIPRTLALTIYGDLDLSVIDELPPGRLPVATRVILPNERTGVYREIRTLLAAGRQAYVICPRIDEPDPTKALALNAKSVKEEAKRLQESVFPEYRVGILHGKLLPKEKEAVMRDFARGVIDILVATSVVEVGVNVPNATVMVIEGAERFGLAQLHQLRGRIVRSTHQAHCFLFTDTKSDTSLTRLKAIVTAKNGFELAEKDLMIRGAGELSGMRQSGISDIGMEAIRNLKLVEAARAEARTLVADDPDLARFPALRERVQRIEATGHFE